MAVKMATLPESGTKRPKPTTPDKRRFCHGAICPTINILAILRYLCGSEMVLLGVVIGKCETPTRPKKKYVCFRFPDPT